MKKFDLAKALAGQAVVTRDGRPVTQLTKFDTTDTYPLIGVVRGAVNRWTDSGKKYLNLNSSYDSVIDLFMAPVKVTRWVNLYPGTAYHFSTQADADFHATTLRFVNRFGEQAYPIEVEVEE